MAAGRAGELWRVVARGGESLWILVVAQIDTALRLRYPGSMRNRTTMNISLTPELESFVDSRVASGRYQSASEVVRAGLRLLEQSEQDREAALAEVRQKIQLGLDQIQRGEVFDGEAVFDELDQEHGA